ncbi:hypothetical protein ACJDT4_21715 [Clostridium neuense]|uniref:DUF3102 domain-containing protein n=1 Tax=Clostridium neuense TaxID=1728934 RepID=A0ABW8TKM4_9CLOT
MSRIEIDISSIRRSDEELRQNNFKLSSISCDIFQSMCNVDASIQARRNIGQRLKNAYDESIKIGKKLVQLEKFISSSMDRYEKAERNVKEQANTLRILMDLRMRTGMEFDIISQMSGTSSAYASENAKMFYDGEKVGDDEDEDTEEILKEDDKVLKETDKILKEVNEEYDDNDWSSKPAKEDIFDKFADWLTEKVTGEKASPKTQGEEVIEAQLTTMSLDEQNILADIANDYQTAFRGLGSADRINEALENFEEEPVISGGNNTNWVRQPVSVNANKIRFSQSSVNGADEIISSMEANGWRGAPIDVVKMRDGNLTTIDNTRVIAAREAGIDVQAILHDANELLPENLIDRFTTKKGVPKTWGEAIELRIGKQKASFRNNNPLGADTMERMGK